MDWLVDNHGDHEYVVIVLELNEVQFVVIYDWMIVDIEFLEVQVAYHVVEVAYLVICVLDMLEAALAVDTENEEEHLDHYVVDNQD